MASSRRYSMRREICPVRPDEAIERLQFQSKR
jgi:hypothetical protein